MAYLGIPPFGSRTSRTVTEVVATGGQTTFYPTGGYIPGYLDVILNGVELNSSDYVATDSSTVVLQQACAAGDEVKLVSFALSLAGNGAYTRTSFTASSNQTTFLTAYTPGAIVVYLNGVLLRDQNYVATDGATIVLDSGVPAGTLVDVLAYTASSLSQIDWAVVKNKPTTLSGYGITDGGGGGAALPSQTGNTGKYLTTNGTVASWSTVDALPTQTGNTGKYLTTNGTVASWVSIDTGGGPISTNTTTVTQNYTIASGNNGFSVGPITVQNGVSVTISNGQRWVIV